MFFPFAISGKPYQLVQQHYIYLLIANDDEMFR